MPRRNLSPIEGQELLFISGSASHEYSPQELRTWEDIEANPALRSPYLQGSIDAPSVDLESRANDLYEALTLMGKANQREGFGIASDIKPHSSEIWGRYQSKTSEVIEGARNNIEILNRKAKEHFWRASGYAALRASGLMPRKEIDARAAQDWMDFSRRYAGPPHRRARDKMKRNLNKQKTAQKKLKAKPNPSAAAA